MPLLVLPFRPSPHPHDLQDLLSVRTDLVPEGLLNLPSRADLTGSKETPLSSTSSWGATVGLGGHRLRTGVSALTHTYAHSHSLSSCLRHSTSVTKILAVKEEGSDVVVPNSNLSFYLEGLTVPGSTVK